MSHYHTIPETNLKISILRLGIVTFGEPNNEYEENINQLDFSTNSSVNFIDTAEMYSAPQYYKT